MGDRQPSDLLISEIRADDNLTSSKKDAVDDMEEMEKLLKSGGAFGGKGLGDTFKKIRGEIQQDGLASNYSGSKQSEKDLIASSAHRSGGQESELDMNNSKLMMESASPGQNTLVMNQINQLTVMDSRGADLHHELHQKAVYEDGGVDNVGHSDSNIDYEGLTESQLLALQEQQNASQ